METGKMINRISNRLRRRSANIQQALGLTAAQGNILQFILLEGREQALYQKDIEKEFDLRPSTATELLKSLEGKKMICRVSSETDGRYKPICFTEAAEDIRAALQEEIIKAESQLVQGIPCEELERFMETAAKMLRNLDRGGKQ